MDRVLEIGGWAASYAGRLLVHAGADVVRIDRTEQDPAWASELAMDAFLHCGKRRIATEDLQLIAELARASDVVICEAGSASELARSGFDNWECSVKVGITPFGRTGPKRDWQATPSTLLAMGGYTYLMGDADRAPLNLPGHYLEFQTGALAVASANSCRWRRERNLAADVSGDIIDIGMLEVVMSLSQFTSVRWHCLQDVRMRHGSDFHFVVPSDLFPCADGWAYISIVPQFWDPFIVFLDRPELAVDPRFSNNDLRINNKEALHAIVGEAMAAMTIAEVDERAETCRVPVGVVRSFGDVLNEQHLDGRDFWETVGDVGGHMLKLPGMPYRFDNEPRATLNFEPHPRNSSEGTGDG